MNAAVIIAFCLLGAVSSFQKNFGGYGHGQGVYGGSGGYGLGGGAFGAGGGVGVGLGAVGFGPGFGYGGGVVVGSANGLVTVSVKALASYCPCAKTCKGYRGVCPLCKEFCCSKSPF
ncbi:hypothetical protein DPMN_115122 [Dreissena polymorpha]|uniref:Uncharacterized protein n=1 Tax=Dreissena polymorpha TaxID=45954 RepID=A0A9D4QSC8_DREPO|nr:hypothetical protein DPMN_115122 [Dreissena polymorpha]